MNKWNFETDKIADAVIGDDYLKDNPNVKDAIFDEDYLYQPTKIYAKWIKN